MMTIKQTKLFYTALAVFGSWMQQGVLANEGSFGFLFQPSGQRCTPPQERAIWEIAGVVGEQFGYAGVTSDAKWLNKATKFEELDQQECEEAGGEWKENKGNGNNKGWCKHRRALVEVSEPEEGENLEEGDRNLGGCNGCDYWLQVTSNQGAYGDCCKCCRGRRRNLRITRELIEDMTTRAKDLCNNANIPCVNCDSAVFEEF